ncbi:hypothetical protein FO519_008311 [Halicephalobus sp. NKZ332]|nr:hypothetical protein FO519_008311 [Halicephalobus sp. NKZ332]
MSDIQIVLEPRRPFYFPGDTISGHVLVTLPKEKKVNEICLEANGRAHVVFWHGNGDDRHCYKGEKIYLRGNVTLWQKNKAKGEKYLPGGTQKYPFSLGVPYNCAPSLEGTHGHIRYKLKARLDLPWALDKSCEQEILVVAPINLSCDPIYTRPHVAHIHKNNAFTPSNTLQATVTIPRAAWVTSETIPVHVSVTNNSSNDVTGIEVAIIKREAFTGKDYRSHCPVTEQCVKKVYSSRAQVHIPSLTSSQTQVDVRVPANLITLTTCSVISMSYEIEVELHTKGIFSSCPSTCIPVIFSNVPMIQSPQASQVPTIEIQPSSFMPLPYPPNPMFPVVGQNEISSFTPMPQSTLYPNAPPPYSLYGSNPTLAVSSSTSDFLSSPEPRPRFPSAPPIESEKVPIESIRL